MAKATDQKLLSLIRAEGPQSPASLISRLGLSQPTLFRSAKAQSGKIASLGGRRNRKIAALRGVRELGSRVPVFQVSSTGDVTAIGDLLTLYPSSCVFLAASAPSKPQFYPGLPYYIDDLRPQGFMGRAFAQKHPDLRIPPRIGDWNNDDILEAIARRGEDLAGNLLIGAESFERHQLLCQSSEVTCDSRKPEKHYVALANAANDGQPSGSSAGGEHPKFGATLRYGDGAVKKVLVKFSPTGNTFAARRWRDLLICESLALEVLAAHHLSAAESRITEAGGRTFLETVRFDRVGAHGRRGVLSMAAFENEWTRRAANWAVSAEFLERERKITATDLKTIRLLECFGRLIANSDRHSGNLSFFWQPGDLKASLAPVYDMLPMLYAPSTGGEDTRKTFSLPTYDHTLLGVWKDALSMAIHYWERVREDPRLSGAFRKTAGQNLQVLG